MTETENKLVVKPFAAIRPVPDLAQELVAPPYDVINADEARTLAEGKPWSFLHISKPEIDLDPKTDPYSPEVYEKGRSNFKRMIEQKVLRQDKKKCFYVYQLKMNNHTQTGIAGAASIMSYHQNVVRRHEYTRPSKETDRVRQIDAVNAQTGPVFTTHKNSGLIQDVIDRVVKGAADYHVIGDGNVGHTLWLVDDDADIIQITRAFEELGVIYIADGHHRSAAAARVAAQRNANISNPTGMEAHDFFLIVSFPETEVKILDYNRIVRDLNGYSNTEFLEKLSEICDLVPFDEAPKPTSSGNYAMYIDGNWYSFTLFIEDSEKNSIVDCLDVSILSTKVLSPLLGIDDPRTDPRIDFVGGIRGMTELEKRVDTGEWKVAFAVFPTTIAELMAVADAEEVMPPKSTWFEPKLADGMVSLLME
tara:strand:- start:650 stop:1909 length:1260 start_codon:yes stop_codon:yes gene_type:complete